MHTFYTDILQRIPEPPKWFDEHAVPRYCEFAAQELAFIYAKEAALALIRCQGCGTEFRVAFSEINTRMPPGQSDPKRAKTIADLITARELHFGDPPNIGCCDAGASMNSVPVRVLEYWYKPIIRGKGVEPHPDHPDMVVVRDIRALNFVRDPALERSILPDWAR